MRPARALVSVVPVAALFGWARPRRRRPEEFAAEAVCPDDPVLRGFLEGSAEHAGLKKR